MAQTTAEPVRSFGPNGWSTLDQHPIEAAMTDDEDWDKGIIRLGWAEFSRTGRATADGTGSGSPFHLIVFHRPHSLEDPQFLIELSGNLGDHYEHVFVKDLPSLMELLKDWAPALQSTALAHLAAALPDDPAQLAGLLAP